MASGEEDDHIILNPETLKILNEFLCEKAEKERKEREQILERSWKSVSFEENWQLSQFWYDENTKIALSKVLKRLITSECSIVIGLLSCPSLYKTFKMITENVRIFEYDQRFSAFGDDFIFYDFNNAESPGYLNDYKSSFDIIVADPPFLSEECIVKMSVIIRKILKPHGKIIFCSGEVVAPWIINELNLKQQKFRPAHERNLGNEFMSYSNFNMDELIHE